MIINHLLEKIYKLLLKIINTFNIKKKLENFLIIIDNEYINRDNKLFCINDKYLKEYNEYLKNYKEHQKNFNVNCFWDWRYETLLEYHEWVSYVEEDHFIPVFQEPEYYYEF
jgi:hypothetical protein